MKKNRTNQHNILRLRHSGDNGVNRVYNKHHIVGFVVHGILVVYNGSTTTYFNKGDIYFLRVGAHYLEHLPTGGRPYEEIVVELSESLISDTLRDMSLAFGMDISPRNQEPPLPLAVEPTSHLLRTFFRGLESYLLLGSFDPCGAMARMKINELLYLIFLTPTSTVRGQLSLLARGRQVLFERTIRDNIFGDTSIAHLATLCNMSPSGFKKEFYERFGDSPHRWFLHQRVAGARALLLHTSDQVKSIARDCGFATSSHFIRHFRRTYGTTPSEFRRLNAAQPSQNAHTHQTTTHTPSKTPTHKA